MGKVGKGKKVGNIAKVGKVGTLGKVINMSWESPGKAMRKS